MGDYVYVKAVKAMTVTIGCYHAHHSNIDYIGQALGAYEVELVHFVDPGMDRLKSDASFTARQGQRKISDMLGWIASCHVDAILVTCTFFTANMTEQLESTLHVPVIKIDDPMLALICNESKPQLLVFTNPATVQGTMDRVQQFAQDRQPLRLQNRLLDGTFQFMMRGNKQAYIERVREGLEQLAAEFPGHRLWAVQLSMVAAAEQASAACGVTIGNVLAPLTEDVAKRLQLKPRIT
jgi:hypothetical protein